jgi:hypothetical protein
VRLRLAHGHDRKGIDRRPAPASHNTDTTLPVLLMSIRLSRGRGGWAGALAGDAITARL